MQHNEWYKRQRAICWIQKQQHENSKWVEKKSKQQQKKVTSQIFHSQSFRPFVIKINQVPSSCSMASTSSSHPSKGAECFWVETTFKAFLIALAYAA